MLTTQDRVDRDYSLAVEVRAFPVEVDKGQTGAIVTLVAMARWAACSL